MRTSLGMENVSPFPPNYYTFEIMGHSGKEMGKRITVHWVMASSSGSNRRKRSCRLTLFLRRKGRVKWMRDQGPALAFMLPQAQEVAQTDRKKFWHALLKCKASQMIQAVFQVPGAFHFLVYTRIFPSWMFVLRLKWDFLKFLGQEHVIVGRTLTPIAGEVLYRPGPVAWGSPGMVFSTTLTKGQAPLSPAIFV